MAKRPVYNAAQTLRDVLDKCPGRELYPIYNDMWQKVSSKKRMHPSTALSKWERCNEVVTSYQRFTRLILGFAVLAVIVIIGVLWLRGAFSTTIAALLALLVSGLIPLVGSAAFESIKSYQKACKQRAEYFQEIEDYVAWMEKLSIYLGNLAPHQILGLTEWGMLANAVEGRLRRLAFDLAKKERLLKTKNLDEAALSPTLGQEVKALRRQLDASHEFFRDCGLVHVPLYIFLEKAREDTAPVPAIYN